MRPICHASYKEILNQNLILIIANPYSSHKETKTYIIALFYEVNRLTSIGYIIFVIILELFKQFNGRTVKYTMNIKKWQNKIII